MKTFKVTRAHLKVACEKQQWDLLDKLLEIDNSYINEASMFTDTWGEWWGLLYHCVILNYETGVRILLKHGAKKSIGNWGDCIKESPMQAAQSKPNILKLLKSKQRPSYVRSTGPEIPTLLTDKEKEINRLADIRDKTGLAFPFSDAD